MGLSGQVILCTKEVSVGARKNAFALLVEMGHAFLRFGPSQEGKAQVTWGWGEHSAPRCRGSTPQNHWPKRKGRECCLALDLSRLLLLAIIPLPGGPRMQRVGWALPWYNLSCPLSSQKPCSATSS